MATITAIAPIWPSPFICPQTQKWRASISSLATSCSNTTKVNKMLGLQKNPHIDRTSWLIARTTNSLPEKITSNTLHVNPIKNNEDSNQSSCLRITAAFRAVCQSRSLSNMNNNVSIWCSWRQWLSISLLWHAVQVHDAYTANERWKQQATVSRVVGIPAIINVKTTKLIALHQNILAVTETFIRSKGPPTHTLFSLAFRVPVFIFSYTLFKAVCLQCIVH